MVTASYVFGKSLAPLLVKKHLAPEQDYIQTFPYLTKGKLAQNFVADTLEQ